VVVKFPVFELQRCVSERVAPRVSEIAVPSSSVSRGPSGDRPITDSLRHRESRKMVWAGRTVNVEQKINLY